MTPSCRCGDHARPLCTRSRGQGVRRLRFRYRWFPAKGATLTRLPDNPSRVRPTVSTVIPPTGRPTRLAHNARVALPSCSRSRAATTAESSIRPVREEERYGDRGVAGRTPGRAGAMAALAVGGLLGPPIRFATYRLIVPTMAHAARISGPSFCRRPWS
jgi:hypothetical protein